jgi:bacteriorhodopsin
MTSPSLNATQYNLIYNFFSMAIAAMGSATVFFFFQSTLVAKRFRTAVVVSSLVTLIAFYHYFRIFESFTEAYGTVITDGKTNIVGPATEFNDAYRYVDWLLTVPLLLMELVLVMGLSREETQRRCTQLGSLAAIMVILGYPGEISSNNGIRWLFWALAMIPFCIIVYTLYFSLRDAIANQPRSSRDLVANARFITVASWCVYPIVFIFPMIGLDGGGAFAAVQIGYSIADMIAKPGLGVLVWMIASRKSENDPAEAPLLQ